MNEIFNGLEKSFRGRCLCFFTSLLLTVAGSTSVERRRGKRSSDWSLFSERRSFSWGIGSAGIFLGAVGKTPVLSIDDGQGSRCLNEEGGDQPEEARGQYSSSHEGQLLVAIVRIATKNRWLR